jgi:glucose/mannose-6-phosphate isomerase
MYKVYDKWPEIAKQAFDSDLNVVNFKNIDHIVFSGMGGSGIIGDIFEAIFSKTNMYITVIKGYILPKTINSKTLVICLSSSGNTTETISILQSAIHLECKMLAIASGGKMEEFCKKNNIPFFKTKLIHSPRASLPEMLYFTLKILQNIIPLKQDDIYDSIDDLENTGQQICSSNLSETNPALNMALWIKNTPVIYYPHGLESIAIRFKNSLQENCKIHAMIENVIEASHNSVVAWENKSNFVPIIIRGVDDHEKTKERWEILKKLFATYDIDFWEISSISGNILSKIMSLIYILDYVTIYRSVLSKIDPSPIQSINFIKSQLT